MATNARKTIPALPSRGLSFHARRKDGGASFGPEILIARSDRAELSNANDAVRLFLQLECRRTLAKGGSFCEMLDEAPAVSGVSGVSGWKNLSANAQTAQNTRKLRMYFREPKNWKILQKVAIKFE